MDSIIFDLDGTLWDPSKTVARAWSEALSNLEYAKGEITEDDLKRTMGLQIQQIAEILFDYLEKDKQMEVINECCRIERRYLRQDGGELFRDLEKVLDHLSKTYKLYIVSNCQDGYIESFYHYHKLEKHFLDYENPGRTGLSKGENIKLIIERNQLKSSIYVGDTQGDKDAADFAGIPFVYAAYGFGELSEYDYKIDQVSDLLEIF
ncbi:HAD family hydrolase [Cytobacillus purgationiresistens]|uniref:Phosphoglycolate phosphatase n=1 Tax=Cytobacillus purgationiresistens TaxID=863449 RepID=A0ABU0AIB8_9BACI|nr:HAD family hydrolase [Cytobacillus purgationiresistens]MDQ0271000.1 phosphoglycolate phosphatase [Cytobacillus purgationiresistens]